MADEQNRTDTTPTRARSCRGAWQRSEPPLGEALADPVVRTMMRADHVDPKDLERNLRAMARKLAAAGRPEAHGQAD
jgi:hypothetical protein